MLQQHGYNTYLVGKYHLMPSEFESAAGPYDRVATPASGPRT
jgi:arylsulfatase A-like enzyme